MSVERVAQRAEAQFQDTLDSLCSYLRHPAISSKPERASDVLALANRVAHDLRELGLESTVHELPDALPLVSAHWMLAPGRPTLLVYGHLDLQPADEPEWETPPHEPTRRGERLFGRGAADDMGGWVSHLAAIRAWLDEDGSLPCNLRLIIEGEEEIGSPNLERYMDAWPEVFEADAMVLTDCENPAPDVPGLTVSLRGLCELELVVDALSADVHSGLWGGMVPDAGLALMRLIDRLTDEDGRLKVGRVAIDDARRVAGTKVPIGEPEIRAGARLLDGVPPLPNRDKSSAEWLWWQPAMTVIATSFAPPEKKKNALRRRASAILSLRAAPGQSTADLSSVVTEALMKDPPFGVHVNVRPHGSPGEGWLYTPRGPAFPAADRAYLATWGRPLVQVGIGGSIPFVALFGRRFGDKPLILNGVMDPATTAHGPNESLHLGTFAKSIQANVRLYDELGRALGAP